MTLIPRYSCETAAHPPSPILESEHLKDVKRVQDKLLLYTGIAQNVNGIPLASLFQAPSTSTSTAALPGRTDVASRSTYVAPSVAPPVAPSAPTAPPVVDADAFLCDICMELSKDTAFGCGHLACHVCAEKISDCHLCKRRITERRRIFFN